MPACPPRGELLAEGGMSRVWAVAGEGSPRVLKRSREPRFNETLLREARLGAEMRHPALLPVLDYGLDEEGLAWLLLPRTPGPPRPLRDPRALFDALGEVADALDLLHDEGWVHGDLKPDNLLAGDPPRSAPLLLCDLGMAGRRGESREGGSLAYLSPRRLAGKPLDPADDLHALAVLAYECLAGRLPYVEEKGEGLLRCIHGSEILPLSRFRPDLPAGLDEVFAAALSGEDRPRSAMELMDRFGTAAGLAARPRALFYRPAAFPDSEALGRGAEWLGGSSSRGSRLGRVLLLEDAGRAEARLLRTSLAANSDLPWMEDARGEGPAWIVFMEESLEAGARPRVAVFGERELDRDQADFLRSRPETLILGWRGWSPALLREWLTASLASVSRTGIPPGDRELDFFIELAREGLDGVEEALAFLRARQLLRSEGGVAAFQAEPAAWRRSWESRTRREITGLPALARRVLSLLDRFDLPLAEEEIAGLLGRGGPPLRSVLDELTEGDWLRREREDRLSLDPARRPDCPREPLPLLDSRWMQGAWRRAEGRPLARLSLIRTGLEEGVTDWLDDLPTNELLPLAQALPLDRLEAFLDEHPSPPGGLALLKLLGDMRRGRLPETVLGFWTLESRLDLETSAELCRRLSNTLMRDKSVEEGFHFLDRWRRIRAEEIGGTQLEIRVAAREVVSYGHFGSTAEGGELLARYREEFIGREGAWFLDWAESLLHSERQEYETAARLMARALDSAESEGNATDRFSLAVHLAELLIVQDRMDEGSRALDRARELAEETGRSEHLRYVHNSIGLHHLGLEEFTRAEEHFRRSLRIAREEGAWREPTAAQNNLALALFRQGEYGRMESVVEEIQRRCEISERLADVLSERNLLALIRMGCGDLLEAGRYLEESLPVARETGARRMEGLLLRKRGKLHMLQGKTADALKDHRRARALFDEIDIGTESLLTRLGEIEVDPDGDGEFLDEALAQLEGPGYQLARILALRLRARRRRLAGETDGADADLKAAFAVARRGGNPEELWPLHAEAAESALAAGDEDRARRELGRALEILRRLAGRFAREEDRRLYLARPDRRACLDRLAGVP